MSSLPLNVGGDFAVINATETVTLIPRVTDSGFSAALTVPAALRRDATREDIESAGGSLGKTGNVFHLWAANIPGGYKPKRRDVLQDADGVRYDVLKVQVQTLDTRFRLTVQAQH